MNDIRRARLGLQRRCLNISNCVAIAALPSFENDNEPLGSVKCMK
jgi:hypothetical protein